MPTNGKKSLSVYVHIPFCLTKCHYCSFYVIPYKEELADVYTNAILREWEYKKDSINFDYEIVSLFLGGGTPTLLPTKNLTKIIRQIIPDNQAEITIESNPENLSPELLSALYDSGITRLSIGVQTFNKDMLKIIGRVHNKNPITNVIHNAYNAGFRNISIDLIYGIPSQTEESWQKDILTTTSLPISHISMYNLTIDPHTVFFKYREQIQKKIPCDEIQNNMLSYANYILGTKGLQRYEIASYALPHHESIHNLGYWTGRDFLGLGVSASQNLNNVRSQNINRFSKYIRGTLNNTVPQIVNEKLSVFEREKEAVALRLRVIEGIPLKLISASLLSMIFNSKILMSFLELKNDHLKLNETGLLFHDTVASEIMALYKKTF